MLLMPAVSEVLSLDLSVNLFHDRQVNAVLFSACGGTYKVSMGDSILGIVPQGSSWFILRDGDHIKVRDHTGSWLLCTQLDFQSDAPMTSWFCLKPVDPVLEQREYHGGLRVGTGMQGFQLMNEINIEKYILGVAETEAGPSCALEYYKVQAILCRTFALRNYNRHEEEGFHLCDGVHCQAYGGRHIWSEDVEIGGEVTSGLVLTDTDSILINPAYHSNSGGETRGAGQIWLKEEPYLRPVLDRFSLGQSNGRWEKQIRMVDWIDYLRGEGALEGELGDTSALELRLDRRHRYYCPFGDSLMLNDIRRDWGLKSDFFDIIRSGDILLLKGRGYGHGVGLSQEGGMHMARTGYHYTEILNYYYHNIRIIHFLGLEDAGIFTRKVLHSH